MVTTLEKDPFIDGNNRPIIIEAPGLTPKSEGTTSSSAAVIDLLPLLPEEEEQAAQPVTAEEAPTPTAEEEEIEPVQPLIFPDTIDEAAKNNQPKSRLLSRIGEAVKAKTIRHQRLVNAKDKLQSAWLKPQAFITSYLASRKEGSAEQETDKAAYQPKHLNTKESNRFINKRNMAIGALAVGGLVLAEHLLFGSSHHSVDMLHRYGTQHAAGGDVITFNPENQISNMHHHVGKAVVAAAAKTHVSVQQAIKEVNKLDNGNITELFPWKVANALAPGHTSHLMQTAVEKLNATTGTHYVLTAHNGTEMYMQGSRVITPHDQLHLDEIIAELAA